MRGERFRFDFLNGGQVIRKEQPSSFTGTDLQERIGKLGKKKLVLAGGSLSCISVWFLVILTFSPGYMV